MGPLSLVMNKAQRRIADASSPMVNAPVATIGFEAIARRFLYHIEIHVAAEEDARLKPRRPK